jgi:FkbM family methyltransferase
MGSPAAAISPTLRAAVTRALHPGFFFVNIGANDGVSNDPIYPFLREHSWHGIVVEPLGPLLEELRSNYRDFPGIIFEQAAIVAAPRPFYYLPASSGYQRTWTKQVGTLNPASLVKTIGLMRVHQFDGPVPPGLEQSVASIEVPCLTFHALMEKHRVERVDFLSIDAESADYEIFCSIDLARWRPRILCIETGDMGEAERADFERRVRAAGYVFLEPFDFLTGVYVQRAVAPRWHTVSRLRRRIGARVREALGR